MLYRIGVVAHHKRATQAINLTRRTQAAALSIDDGTLGCEANHAKTLRTLIEQPADWYVLLEDDAEPIDGFTTHLAAALAAAPAPIVSFYLGTSYPRHWQRAITRALHEADATGSAWITSGHLLHAVAYAIHKDHAPHLLQALPELRMPIDDAITTWAHTNHHQVAYTASSLVDHEDGDSVITTRAPRRAPRHAHRTGTPHRWDTPAVELTYT